MKHSTYSYQDALTFLFERLPMYQRTGKTAYRPGLDTALAFDVYFQSPHRNYPTVHVAGTNGKGSVSHMLASVLQSAGYRTGLFTSPHLKDFRERIRVNGEPVAETEVVDFVLKHKNKIEDLKPSFFEMTSAMAFDCFARQQVDIAVIETGMGGRLDSTNIINPVLSVITNIGWDHTEHLGNTLQAIATEKAGIIKSDTPVIIGEWQAETAPVFNRIARAQHSPLFYANRLIHAVHTGQTGPLQHFSITADNNPIPFEISVDLGGYYQRKNIATALVALDTLRGKHAGTGKNTLPIPDSKIAHGLQHLTQQTGLRGRWEIISRNPLIICDTGHNAHGLQETMPQLRTLDCRRLHIVFGVMQDKDLNHILPLMPTDACYYFTQAALPRAMNAQVLADHCRRYGLYGQTISVVSEAIEIARHNASPEDVIFVGGSTFVVAEALPAS